jgi:hypothetical protein
VLLFFAKIHLFPMSTKKYKNPKLNSFILREITTQKSYPKVFCSSSLDNKRRKIVLARYRSCRILLVKSFRPFPINSQKYNI